MAGNPNPRTDHLVPYQFKPGQSGNPAGGPKNKLSLVRILEDQLMNLTSPEFPDRNLATLLVQKTILDALNGDSQSRKLVWEFMEGKPGLLKQLTGEDDIPVIRDDV